MTIPHEQQFIIYSRLRLNCLDHPIEIKTHLVNEDTSIDYYFVVWFHENSLHRIPQLACHLHEHVGLMCLYQI